MNIRVVNPQKFYTRIGLLLLIVTLLAGFALERFMTPADIRIDSDAVQTVTVAPGDTIWSIASRYMPEKTDLRFKVQDIIKLNNLGANGTIQPGQKILLPLDKSDALILAKQN